MLGSAGFAMIAGGAAAALVGLLFVAVPIRAESIGRSVVVALGAGATFSVLNVRAEHAGERTRVGRALDRLNPDVTTAVLVGLAGILLMTVEYPAPNRPRGTRSDEGSSLESDPPVESDPR